MVLPLPRSHLIARLRQEDVRVTAVVAPLGYGKTDLLLRTVAQTPRACLARLMDADPDPVSIVRLIHSALPPVSGGRLAFELERQDVTPNAVAAALRHDLGLLAPVTLALDDLHELNAESRSFLLTRLLSRLHEVPGVRLILAMRTERDLPLGQLRHLLRIETLDINDLALRDDEALALGLRPEQVAHAHGWTGLALSVADGYNAHEYVRSLEVGLPPELWASLRRASVLRVWRRTDFQLHEKLRLSPNWLEAARAAGVPCLTAALDEYIPHPRVLDVLREELQAHPEEQREVELAVASALASDHPLMAIDAYLRAGDRASAVAVFERVAGSFRASDQLASLLPRLRDLEAELSPELRVVYGQALFESGRIPEGLQVVTAACQGEAATPENLSVLAGLWVRVGNLERAHELYLQALRGTPDPAEAVALRAQLAFALALGLGHAQNPDVTRVEAEAQRVLDEQQTTVPGDLSLVMALTASTLALAYRGDRAAARLQAGRAADLAAGVLEQEQLVTIHAALAGFWADDGDETLAGAHLAAGADVPLPTGSDRRMRLTLAKARLMLRRNDFEAVIRDAGVAMHHARGTRDHPGEVEATLLLAISAVLIGNPISGQMIDRLASITANLTGFQHATAILHALDRQRRGGPAVQHSGGSHLPLEVRALLSVLRLGEASTREAQAEFADVSSRLGPGALSGYARALQVDLPTDVVRRARPQLHVRLLQDRPEIRVNGQPVELSNSLLLTLAALLYHRQVDRGIVSDLYGEVDDARTVNKFQQNMKRLKQVLGEASGLAEPLGRSKTGTYSLDGWDVVTDLQALATSDVHMLVVLYRAPLLSGVSEVGLVERWRQEVRRQLWRRLTGALDPLTLRTVASAISQVDPLFEHATEVASVRAF